MAVLLLMETAAAVCSVALSKDGTLLGIRESHSRNVHAERVSVFTAELLADAGLQPEEVDAVAVSMGPGSYTGLRIGVASAKGFCYATGKPLVAIPTLQAMALGMKKRYPEGVDLWCPMLDARRMEVYCALYDAALKPVGETMAEIITEQSFTEYFRDHFIVFGGEGAEKCREILGLREHARFLEGFETSAAFLMPLAEERFAEGRFEDPAYFEPFYLKEFIAGKPRVKGLHLG
jgi:tRNA threonylcarbamoyladenosine biosynthesis protein TsaB